MTADLAPPVVAPGSIDVSVVLPVYNEVGHLAQEVKRIRTALDASGRT